jgi:hypothetical protein
MGFLDGLFGKEQFDPRAYDGANGSGWLGPLAGGRPPIDQMQPFGGAAPTASPGNSVAPFSMADTGIGRPADQQNPLGSLFGGIGHTLSGGIAGLFGQGGPPGMTRAPGLLDRLSAGATNLTTGGNPIAGIVNAVNGLATGQRTDAPGIVQAQQAALRQALAAAGVPDALASAAALSPDVLKAIIPRLSAMPRSEKPADAGGSEPTMDNPDRRAIVASGVAGGANAASQGRFPQPYAQGAVGRAGFGGAGNPVGGRPGAPPTRAELEAELRQRAAWKRDASLSAAKRA